MRGQGNGRKTGNASICSLILNQAKLNCAENVGPLWPRLALNPEPWNP